ncbi:MAG: response regulator [Solirubrobacteraceae bacterium]
MTDRFVPASERTRREHAIDHAALLPTILFADADGDYRDMARDALLEGRSPSDLRFVTDGQDLLAYLHRRGRHLDPIGSPRPALIVLDIGLPKLGGLEAVRAIKSNPELRRIPVVALTDDVDAKTVAAAYDAGVNTYLAKPVTFLALVKLMKIFTAYWLDTALLPPAAEAA